jgi:hypothetical protein
LKAQNTGFGNQGQEFDHKALNVKNYRRQKKPIGTYTERGRSKEYGG